MLERCKHVNQVQKDKMRMVLSLKFCNFMFYNARI